MASLDQPVSELPKVKPAELKAFHRLEIATVRDLLLHLPFDWEAYGAPVPIRGVAPGAQATIIGNLVKIEARRSMYKRKPMTEATLEDDFGGRLKIVWFNQPWLPKSHHAGDR
ncbi:MAG: hypothetical protein E6J29_14755, partial [Chloroflexi bacterium]